MPTDPQPCASTQAAATGWGVNPFGLDFPFRSPSPDVRGLIVDFQLSLDGHAALFPPLRVAWVSGLHRALCLPGVGTDSSHTPAHDVDVVVLDAHDNVVFDSTAVTAFSSVDFGTSLRVHRWSEDQAACTMVQRVGWPIDVPPPADVPSSFSPHEAVLDARCHAIMSKRLRSLKFGGHGGRSIELVAGYNSTLDDAQSVVAGRRRNRVTFGLSPGAGEGRSPGCTDYIDSDIRTINGQGPDELGNVNISGDGCVTVRPLSNVFFIYQRGATRLAVMPEVSAIQFDDVCSPCCPCDFYVNTQTAIKRIWDLLAAASSGMNDAAIAGADIATRWDAAKACRESQTVSMNAITHDTRLVDVSGGICNHEAECLDNVELRFSITAAGGAIGVLVPGSAMIYDGSSGWIRFVPIPGGSGIYSAFWDRIPIGGTTAVKFQVKMVPTTAPGVPITVVASAFAGGVPLPGVVTRVVTFLVE